MSNNSLQLRTKTIVLDADVEILCLISGDTHQAQLVEPPSSQMEIELESDTIQVG